MAALLTAFAAQAQTPPETIYNQGGIPPSLPQIETDANATGQMQTYRPAGGIASLANEPFFQPLGSNGRSCATCHQPPSAMSMSLANVQARYTATGGLDPLFAPIDGANCPNLATSRGQPVSAYSLLLSKGVVRVTVVLPAVVGFTIAVVSDPTGCNTNPAYNRTIDPVTGKVRTVVSVFRRPLPSTNLPFVTNPVRPERGAALPLPAINWDGGQTNLTQQAIAAATNHFELAAPLGSDQIAAMVNFESSVYSAQITDNAAGSLTGASALGGAVKLSTQKVGQFAKLSPSIGIYGPWGRSTAGAARQSINRGQAIFNNRTFPIRGVEGIPNGLNAGTCEFCHSQISAANDPTGQRFLLGVGQDGSSPMFNGPAPDPALPLFQITCKGAGMTGHHGKTLLSNDPGKAMVTGMCGDLTKFKIPVLRGLAGRAPYFHDGNAATLMDVVNFYDTRFSIGFSAQDKQDLVNFLGAL